MYPFSLPSQRYICTRFWKRYAKWINFIMIIHITNKVFIIFLTRKNSVRYQYTINIFIFLKKLNRSKRWNFYFSVSYQNFFLSFICGKKFLYFIMFNFTALSLFFVYHDEFYNHSFNRSNCNIAYLWLKSKIYLNKVQVTTNNTLMWTIGFFNISSFKYINPTIFY